MEVIFSSLSIYTYLLKGTCTFALPPIIRLLLTMKRSACTCAVYDDWR